MRGLMVFFIILFSFSLSSSALDRARISYEAHNYQEAIFLLTGERDVNLDGLWIMAESYYRLSEYASALRVYEQIIEKGVALDKKKAHLRLFSIYVHEKIWSKAKEEYDIVSKYFKVLPGQVGYSWGKSLYDNQEYAQAKIALKKVAKGDEFYLRSRYILGTIELIENQKKTAIAIFSQMQKEKPVSVEDLGVLELAKMAEARIYHEEKRFLAAKKAYEKVDLFGAYGEILTRELVGMYFNWASLINSGKKPYDKLSALARKKIAQEKLHEASLILEKFFNQNQYNVKMASLLDVLGLVYAYCKRHDEAQEIYNRIINYYDGIKKVIKESLNQEENLWLCFDLNSSEQTCSYLANVPDIYVKNILEIKLLKEIKNKIIFNRENINHDKTDKNIERDYDKLATKAQMNIKLKVLDSIDQLLLNLRYNSAKAQEMRLDDFKEQLKYFEKYQDNNIQMWDKKIQKMTDGGSS